MSPSRLRSIRAVVAKDLRVARSSKAVTLPLIIVPLVFVVVLPIGLALLARLTPAQGTEDLMRQLESFSPTLLEADRKSTRLNSSHVKRSYAVFCLKT